MNHFPNRITQNIYSQVHMVLNRCEHVFQRDMVISNARGSDSICQVHIFRQEEKTAKTKPFYQARSSFFPILK